ncbi:hypothetical protein LBMAG53_01700 [Planctomycetota bacterium]|nr:hypothetical protein LBMAG53_01700 [Planctomycetota bacterium]
MSAWGLAIGGAALAAGPPIIHWLFRRRLRRVEFAALRFLLRAQRRTLDRLRREEWLVIALRMLALALVGLLLADPVSDAGAGHPGAGALTVAVLDDSLSMGHRPPGGTTVLDRAVTALADHLNRADPDHRVAVLSASRCGRSDPLPQPAPAGELKRSGFAERLAVRPASDLVADPAAALTAAAALANAHRGSVTVWWLTDLRHGDLDGTRAARLKSAAATLPADARLVVQDLGQTVEQDLAVESVLPPSHRVVAGSPAVFRARIRNAGQRSSAATTVSIQIGDAAVPPVAVPALGSGEAAEITCTATCPEPGDTAITVALPADELPGDDRGSCVVTVHRELVALVLAKDPRIGAARSLAIAIDPLGDGGFAQRVRQRTVAGWDGAGLDDVDVVLIDNPGAIAPAARTALTAWIKAGGGLGLILGPTAELAAWSQASGSDPPLAPVELLAVEQTRSPAVDDPTGVRLRPDSIQPGSFLSLFSADARFADLVRFRQPAAVRPMPGARVLGRFDDAAGSPAAVAWNLGRGQVVAICTGLDLASTAWSKDPTFLPVINDLVWQLCRGDPPRVERAGAALSEPLTGRLADAVSATLTTPRFPAEDLIALAVDGPALPGGRVLRHAADHAGVYVIHGLLADGSHLIRRQARVVDPAELDLARATPGALHAALGRPYELIDGGSAASGGVALRWWLLAGLLVVLVAETLLAQRFGHHEANGAAPPRLAV